MKKLNTEDFIRKSKNIHKEKYEYSKSVYVKSKEKIEIICPIHGSFWQKPNHHLEGKGCLSCGEKKAKPQMTSVDFIEKSKIIHNNFYQYDVVSYNGNKIKVEIFCPIHGSFWQTPNVHLDGHGCSKCGDKSCAEQFKYSNKEFIDLASYNHNKRYEYKNINYVNSREKIEITCPKHGSFWQIPSDHLDGHGCWKCFSKISKMENEWLNSLNIPNDKKHRQVRLPTINGHINVDGFETNSNTVYEFWGDYWHGNPQKYELTDTTYFGKTFSELHEKTQQKIKDIEDSGYNLVQIWESEYKEQIKQRK